MYECTKKSYTIRGFTITFSDAESSLELDSKAFLFNKESYMFFIEYYDYTSSDILNVRFFSSIFVSVKKKPDI